MSGLPSMRSEISPERKRILKEVVITDNGPGTILRDFDAFLDYLGGRDLPVSGAHQLPRNVLPEINARLAHPLQLDL